MYVAYFMEDRGRDLEAGDSITGLRTGVFQAVGKITF
jgi:hypothetical protein